MVVKLPRQAGQKDARYAHLLCGAPEMDMSDAPAERTSRRANEAERIAQLEEQVQILNQQIENLTTQFAEFKKQFE
jgi:uncharacterized protein YceH (UPF0502 family)